jgi:hypothetical protein
MPRVVQSDDLPRCLVGFPRFLSPKGGGCRVRSTLTIGFFATLPRRFTGEPRKVLQNPGCYRRISSILIQYLHFGSPKGSSSTPANSLHGFARYLVGSPRFLFPKEGVFPFAKALSDYRSAFVRLIVNREATGSRSFAFTKLCFAPDQWLGCY